MPRNTYGEAKLVVVELLPDFETRLYRVTKSDDPSEEEFLDSLRSHYEIGWHPRGAPRPAVLHMGLSMFRTPEKARGTAWKWPVMGEFVAELELTSGNGFNLADTGAPGHVTVWGDPMWLRDAVVDILPVEE